MVTDRGKSYEADELSEVDQASAADLVKSMQANAAYLLRIFP